MHLPKVSEVKLVKHICVISAQWWPGTIEHLLGQYAFAICLWEAYLTHAIIKM